MANTTFQLRRSSVAGKVPNTSTLSIGELGINLTDQVLYSSNGSGIFEIGANNTNASVTGNLTLFGLIANGSIGGAGNILKSDGTKVYWDTAGAGSVTEVASGSGLTGGPITTTGTLSVLANSGIIANSTGLFVRAGTGTVVNSTGVHVSGAVSGVTTLAAGNTTITGFANVSVSVNSAILSVGTAFIANSTTMKATGVIDTASANILSQTLTDAVNIDWDTSSGQIASVTLAGNRTMNAPTNLKVGTYILNVIQDATGTRTLNWNAVFKWPAGVAPTLTTTANARDVFSFFSDGTNLYGSYIVDVK